SDTPIHIEFHSHFGGWQEKDVVFKGIIRNIERRYKETSSEQMLKKIEDYMSEIPCPKCKGKRLNENSLAVTVNKINIIDLTDLSIGESLSFFENIELNEKEKMISEQI